MDKNRLEAFSDGVMAIIITIMVLQLQVPQSPTWESYLDAYPIFVSYALSFVFVGFYWSSHHHLFHSAVRINNKVLWANMLGLFWLSLIPFTTAAMGQNVFTSVTVTVYAAVLILQTASYLLLASQLRRLHGPESEFSKAYGGHFRSYVTLGINTTAAIISITGFPKIAFCMIAFTSLVWFLPNWQRQYKAEVEEQTAEIVKTDKGGD